MNMKKTQRFKQLILAKEILVLPDVHDALCAKIAEKIGFKAIFVGGYSNSAAQLAKPDISLLTLPEMVDCASRIVDATNLPVFADGDTGHGGIPNVERTVKLFEKSGVASLFIEDQVFPKRCGHMLGKQIISTEEMVAKIKVAVDTRIDNDFMIMARTDAIAVNGIEDAIERAHRYVEAGADIIFIESPTTAEELCRIPKEVKVPNMANMIFGGRTPLQSEESLEKMGFAAVVYSTSCTYVVAQAVQDYFKRLLKAKTLLGMDDIMMHFEEFNELVGLNEIRKKENKYKISAEAMHSDIVKAV